MFGLFSSTSLGIWFSDTECAAAVVSGNKILGKATMAMEGDTKDIAPLFKNLQKHPKKASVCVPVDWIYGTTLTFSPDHKRVTKDDVKTALIKAIPEDADAVEFQYAVISKTKEGSTVAVLAMRKDKIEGIHDTLKLAGLSATRITTLPLSVASHEKRVEIVLADLEQKTISLFENGWLLDEATVQAGLEADAIGSIVEEMSQTNGKKVTHTIVVGSEATGEKVTKALPWLKDTDPKIVGAVAAAVAGSKVHKF